MLSRPGQQADQVTDPRPRAELDLLRRGGRGLPPGGVKEGGKVALSLREQGEHLLWRRRRPRQAALLPLYCRRWKRSPGIASC